MNPQGRAIQIGTGTSTGRTLGLGWDGLGQLASVTSAAGTQRYAYAPTGLRVQVQDSLSPARNRRYAYSSGGLLMSEFTQAGWKRDVVYLGSEAVAEVDGAGVHELHNDHLGTPRIVTSRATRRIEGRQAFGPYGEVLAAQTEGYRPLTGYTGHLQTEDTGLIYMRGRYYSPAWHRFLNSDQGADPSTWNQVAYVGGSPFMAIDPSGMATVTARCADGRYITFEMEGDPSIEDARQKAEGKCTEASAVVTVYASTGGINYSGLGTWGSGGGGGYGGNDVDRGFSGTKSPQTPQEKPKKSCFSKWWQGTAQRFNATNSVTAKPVLTFGTNIAASWLGITGANGATGIPTPIQYGYQLERMAAAGRGASLFAVRATGFASLSQAAIVGTAGFLAFEVGVGLSSAAGGLGDVIGDIGCEE